MRRLSRSLVAGALLLAGCAARPPAAASPAIVHRAPLPAGADEDWPMFRDDVERSGFAEGSRVGARVEEVWRIPSFNTTDYGAAKGSPSIVGDLLYCGTDTGRFLAARVADGVIVWQVQLAKTTHGIHGSPAIVGDVVYIGAYDGTLYAFERRTGLLLWRHNLGYQVGASPAVVPAWGIVFSSHERSHEGGGYVVALDARTGEEIWQQPTTAHPHSSVAVDVERALVFVGDNRGIVYAFRALDGAPVWRRQLPDERGKADVKTTPMVLRERGLVVVGAWSGRLSALDEQTGRVVWEHDAGGRLMASPAYLPATGAIFVASPSGVVSAVDAGTGALRWSFRAGGHVYSSPAVSGDGRAVVFGASDGAVYAVGAGDGSLLWRVDVGGVVSGSPSLVGDRIYVTSKKGGLFALVTTDGLGMSLVL